MSDKFLVTGNDWRGKVCFAANPLLKSTKNPNA